MTWNIVQLVRNWWYQWLL